MLLGKLYHEKPLVAQALSLWGLISREQNQQSEACATQKPGQRRRRLAASKQV
jgi:hypothetical protein